MRQFVTLVFVVSGLACAQQPQATAGPAQQACGLKGVIVQVRLLSPLGTETAKPGDAFTSAVQTPPEYAGGVVEGSVKDLVKAERGFGKGKPRISLEFTTLTYGNETCRINGELQAVANSKGVAKVDDEGRAVGHTSNKPRILSTIGGGLAGAAIGAAAGGGVGAAAGGAAGAATGFLLSSTMTTAGTDIQFQPGAIFTLKVSDVKDHGGRAQPR